MSHLPKVEAQGLLYSNVFALEPGNMLSENVSEVSFVYLTSSVFNFFELLLTIDENEMN